MSFDVDRFARELQKEIMQEVRKKYSATVIHHWMNPMNFKRTEKSGGYGRVTGFCGDTMEIFIKVEGDKISDCSFFTDGCGTTIASGSLVVSLARGKSILQATQITQKSILDACEGLPDEDRHCAELAANTLQYAIIDYQSAFPGKSEQKEGE